MDPQGFQKALAGTTQNSRKEKAMAAKIKLKRNSVRNALHPRNCPYLFGPSLVGEGNILSLLIAAVGQDVDDGDFIHPYGHTSCEESTTYSRPLGLYRSF